jgi:hypothetical protein
MRGHGRPDRQDLAVPGGRKRHGGRKAVTVGRSCQFRRRVCVLKDMAHDSSMQSPWHDTSREQRSWSPLLVLALSVVLSVGLIGACMAMLAAQADAAAQTVAAAPR